MKSQTKTRTSLARYFVLAIAALAGFSACTKKEKAENTLNRAIIANVKGLDPANASDLYVHTVLSHVNEGLFTYHYLKRPLTLVPLLAEALPQISKDGKTVTVKIKKGVKFSDDVAFPGGKGREMNANDFVYSWKRLADPENRSDGWWVLDDRIVGLNDWRTKKGEGKANYDTAVEGLQVPDSHTLVLKLTKPNYQLPYLLAMPYAYVVAREAVEKYGKEYLNHPIGTGPFVVSEWVHNNKIVLTKNPNWRGDTYPTEGAPGDKEEGLLEDAGKPIPFVDKIVINEIIEDQPRWLNLLKGNLDYSSIPKDNFDGAVDRATKTLKPEVSGKGLSLYMVEEMDVTFTSFNMEDNFFGKHKLVRQAICSAIDKAVLIDKFYNGRAIPAQGPIPPGIDGYDANFKNPYSQHDLAKAKELLKKAGFADGKGVPPLTYEATNSTTARQMAELFQHEMSAIGIKVDIKVNTWPEMTDKIKNRKAQIFGMAWGADYPDAENFLQLFFGPNKSPGSNNSNYDDPEFNRIYKEAINLAPSPKRTELYKKLRDIVVDDSPWCFDVHRTTYYLRHAWTKNFKPNDVINSNFRYMKVEPEARAQQKSKL